jgi:phosphoglucosamine mutase
LPTPAVALLALDLGAVISASHNPPEYNGVKFFDGDGRKLSDASEEEIEALLDAEPAESPGAIDHVGVATDSYLEHIVERFGSDLSGLRIAVDCANGAYSGIAPQAFEQLGAEVTTVAADPDGENINVGCGATDLSLLQGVVTDGGFDLGIAFDGDGDRMLAVDGEGNAVDGDQILAVLALDLHERGELVADTLVATVMSNLGLLLAMEREGVRVEQTPVGDRYVLERMRAGGFTLGGEQSGHVIVSAHGSTGDGVLTGLLLASRMAQTGRSLADLAGVMQRLPQVMVNVADVDKARASQDERVLAAVQQAEVELAGTGRVLLRPSGTEPLVRVMVEAGAADQAQALADRLAGVVRERLAL